MRILIAEDDARLLKSLLHVFEMNRLLADGVTNGNDALTYALSGEYDGLVLDIMMPGLDGIQVLTALRERGITTPTLFLTARSEIAQRVEGLEAGADDYLPKPFATRELIARVRAMLRRKDQYTPDLLTFNETVLNRSTFELGFDGQLQQLCGKEFQLIEMLMERPHTVLSTKQLITHIWGWDASVDTSVVWTHISNLRKKIDALGAPIRIRFIRNSGYILEEAL